MIINLVIAVVLLAIGLWCLLYAERIQVRITAYHEDLKRTERASTLFLHVTSRNYELPIRALGFLLILLFLVQLVRVGVLLERGGMP